MNQPKSSSNPFLLLCMGLVLFFGGCTFLLNSEELLQECVTEIDCADGFYCDDGACLPGEAPLPFNPEEPNLPSFNEDAGAPQDPSQASSDAGPTHSDAGQSQMMHTDAGMITETAIDAGVTTAVTTDAGVLQELANDAGTNNTMEETSDAGPATTAMNDAGTSIQPSVEDSGTQDSATTSSDAGQSPAETTDAG